MVKGVNSLSCLASCMEHKYDIIRNTYLGDTFRPEPLPVFGKILSTLSTAFTANLTVLSRQQIVADPENFESIVCIVEVNCA